MSAILETFTQAAHFLFPAIQHATTITSVTLKIGATCSSKIAEQIHVPAQCNNPGYYNLFNTHKESLETCIKIKKITLEHMCK